MNRRGLSGQPWYTPTSCRTGSVAPSAALPTTNLRCMRRVWSRSVVATKFCSWQPLYALNPFCAMSSSPFASRYADSRRASRPL
ncbi:hypothetical protein PHYSODRAFT_534165 [Phytophthora sojae]|uniref:Uncharacterized protein n=1 Tax=Phytophthora sojae (strain P6497) TaxID=1094619 RepID=G5AGC4_PHYSP|nr:hypothetical protein PHYSODRAFT_533502 [Phytophthora sojae]XP_009539167.1 hypothetical protein PHYSODRAFT_534165 [Phytophthora sojae]EGZ05635.1 hypothetical protein PHYSODRAFT_533502 [Phytophthora sojae]EGZ05636.1 hypothetical protein PHYSODRAFT_534165 [Phytophthora sojae]|eukprot:XP_009539166.1 hypothetical protein PHYSODRAFT_533502 [Phytophthora sojae]